MTKRPMPWDDQVDLISSDDESANDADMDTDVVSGQQQTAEVLMNQPAEVLVSQPAEVLISHPADTKPSEGSLIKRAKMYQEYMKNVQIPSQRGSVIPCNSWMGLARSIKELYGQPMHYLTNILLKQWDQARFETGEEYEPLDTVIHPLKAEATIWLIEEVHRRTASYHQLAKLWLRDPMHHAFIDRIIPKIGQ